MDKLKAVTDALDRGLLVIDEEERILVFNHRAKEITGILFESSFEHPPGQIEEGDVVLIADTALGGDDGKLTKKDLKLLGINDERIETGDMLLAVGVYGGNESNVKFFKSGSSLDQVSLEDNRAGKHLSITISTADKRLRIGVDDKNYDASYMHSFGHVVVLSPKGELKFVQAKGYSYRGEGIGELLRGKPYLEKKQAQELEVLGKKASDVFDDSTFLSDIKALLAGEERSINSRLYSVQQRQIICRMMLSKNDFLQAVVISIEDASKLKRLLEERNQILVELEETLMKKPRNEELQEEHHLGKLIGISSKMNEVKYLAKRAGTIQSNVLITGENGTGKTFVAREIHLLGGEGPFIEVNCGSIPHTLFESELFGYKGGSFTGALPQGKEGFFDSAQGGTIFLDEISEIPPFIQSKLLHVIQDKEFYPIGSSQPRKLHARIIAASNRNLKEEIDAGRFREDLFYRLNVFPILLPPLRDRKEDLYPLVEAIKERICRDMGIANKEVSGSAMKQLMGYRWPGNIRELENILERSIIVCEGDIIYPEHLNIPQHKKVDYSLRGQLEEAEKKIFQEVLVMTDDKKEMMEILGISKASLYEKLKKYGLS